MAKAKRLSLADTARSVRREVSCRTNWVAQLRGHEPWFMAEVDELVDLWYARDPLREEYPSTRSIMKLVVEKMKADLPNYAGHIPKGHSSESWRNYFSSRDPKNGKAN